MDIIKQNRLFPNFKAQENGDKSFKGVQLYTGIRSIEGKIRKLLGNAACCDIDGKVEYYNIKSMKNFLELNHFLRGNAQLNRSTVESIISSILDKMRNPDIGKSSEIGSEPEQTPLSSEVKKLSKEKFQKQILEPLKLCGLMMEIEEGSLGEKSVEGVLLRSFEEGEIESILFSDLTILQACVQFLIKNKTEASSITEKVQSAIFTSKEEKEQITLFVNRAINLAFDVPVQDLYSIKADELKSVTPLSHFQEEEALSSMSLDNIERKEGQEALAFIHQRKAEEGSIILSIGRVETAIQILTDVDSYTERSALVKERTSISEHNIIYSFSKQSLLNAFSRLGLSIDVYQSIVSTESQKDAVLDRIQLVGPAVRVLKELIYSTQQVSGGPSSRDIDIILKKEPKGIQNLELHSIFLYMRQHFLQKENQFVREVDTFIRTKLAADSLLNLCEMAWNAGGRSNLEHPYQEYFQGIYQNQLTESLELS